MDFKLALSLLKDFSACHPRIYKQFAGFPDSLSIDSESGYVLFVDTALAKRTCYLELIDVIEKNNLSIESYRNSLLISDPRNKKDDRKWHLHFGKNQLIMCRCLAKILLVPDVKEMDRAIINHADSHARKEKDPDKAEAVFEQIQNYLVEQALEASCEENTQKPIF
jgi:hypothetical protein